MLNTPQDFMQIAERVIVQQFLTLPRAVLIHTPYGNAVYVPPTRADSVLLVAHTDTVFGSQHVRLNKSGELITSARKDMGIGADDRAGVAALWSLRSSGHALLIVPAEETGCQGSGWLARHYSTNMLHHQYMIQFDRRGSSDLVRYSCGNDAFDDYLLASMQGYKLASGSFSDICELAPAASVAAVNISIGFKNEHTARESLDMAAWTRTVESVRAMIAQPCPQFEYIQRTAFGYHWGCGGADSFALDGYPAAEPTADEDEPLMMPLWFDDTCPDCGVDLVEWEDGDIVTSYCPDCMTIYEDVLDDV